MDLREHFLGWYLTGPLRPRLWSELRAIGSSSVFKKAPIFFVGIPIAVAVIEKFQFHHHTLL